MVTKKRLLYIFSHNVEPDGISGGETILIETFRRIAKDFSSVVVYTWRPGKDLYTKYGLKNVTYNLSHIPVIKNFYASFILRTFYGFWLGISLRLVSPSQSYVYFSSDFWPDAIPVILLKLRYSEVKFIGNFFLTAPNPFFGFDEEKIKFHTPSINNIFFFLMQKPVYWFSRYFADLIFVTSQPDVQRFPKQKEEKKIIVIKGGVNLKEIRKFQQNQKKGNKNKIFDGVFMGRFHPQKGVLELIDIWKNVVKKHPDAKLVMIGDGSLMQQVKRKIQQYGLKKNIILTGYIFDKSTRYTIFNQSRIALHPALYDSGGMSVAEAMAFGLPAVSFDLIALRTYYPKGVVKIKRGKLDTFSKAILQLLENKNFYEKIKQNAVELIESSWDWNIRANEIKTKIMSL